VEAPRRPVQPQAADPRLRALPQIWLFQIAAHRHRAAGRPGHRLEPDLGVYGFAYHFTRVVADDLIRGLEYWAAFILLDLSAGAIGMALERRAPWATWSGCRCSASATAS
jgi:hypothetical protein